MEKIDKNKYKSAISYIMSMISNMRLKEPITIDDRPEYFQLVVNAIKKRDNLDLFSLNESEYDKYELCLTDLLSDIIDSPVEDTINTQVYLLNNSREIYPILPKHNVRISDKLKLQIKSQGLTLSGIESYFLKSDYAQLINIKSKEYIFCTKKILLNGTSKIVLAILDIDRPINNIESYILFDLYVVSFSMNKEMHSSPIRLFFSLVSKYSTIIEFKGIKKKIFIDIEERDFRTSLILRFVERAKKGSVMHFQQYPITQGLKQVGIWMPIVYIFDEVRFLSDLKNNKV